CSARSGSPRSRRRSSRSSGPSAAWRSPARSSCGEGETMTSSSEQRPLPMRQLRAGAWPRLGGSTVFGDPVTEDVLSSLAARAESAPRAQGYAHGWSAGRREPPAEKRAAARHREAAEQERWHQRERDPAAKHAAALDG